MEKSSKTKIAFDTNMLLALNELKVDVFEEAKKIFGKTDFIIPEAVIKEMEKLKKKGRNKAKSVSIAEKLIKINECKILSGNKSNADEELLEKSTEGIIIATNDRELRKKIKKAGGKILFLRQKKILEIE